MDFFDIEVTKNAKGDLAIGPSFRLDGIKDLMIRGHDFYAVWDADRNVWSRNERDVARLVDEALWEEYKKYPSDVAPKVKTMTNYSSGKWKEYKQFIKSAPDIYKQLNQKVIFSNTKTKREDYSTFSLDYPLEKGDISAYEEAVSTWYDEANREKLEWAVGAVISGDSKKIQKFMVLYGPPKTGKSSFLNIVQSMFKKNDKEKYYDTGDLSAIGSNGNQFSLEIFKNDPLIMIQHDSDLSKIADNTKLNSVISHEEQSVNEKYMTQYTKRFGSFIFIGTNKPVRITDINSGLTRRMIDVYPTGNTIEPSRYDELMGQIEFEKGAIAKHCLDVYKKLGKNHYDKYKPTVMMDETNYFYTFVEEFADKFAEWDGISLTHAYSLYKQYVEDTGIQKPMNRMQVKNELKGYFQKFYIKKHTRTAAGDAYVSSYYEGFLSEKVSSALSTDKQEEPQKEEKPIKKSWIVLKTQNSILDTALTDLPAQYANENGTPMARWSVVKTKLSEIDTSKTHYVKLPKLMIVIDFDKKDENGNKSFELNLEAASKWPKTYAEVSKSGQGIHLHYYYDGDVDELFSLYEEDVEVKVFKGNSALRRKLTKCTNNPIAILNSNLPKKPKKEAKQVLNNEAFENEGKLRATIKKALQKRIPEDENGNPAGHTKPCVDFINKLLDEAYESGKPYDVSDMHDDIWKFASNSSNNSAYCLRVVSKMHFHSENDPETIPANAEKPIVFYDVEVYPNLFVVCFKKPGTKEKVKSFVNPTPLDISNLIVGSRLVGFNNRRYDNHILYARLIGYDNAQLYQKSQHIINSKSSNSNEFFRPAYNLSYTDIYDFCSKKQSLKKWEIELGIHHQEMGIPWDQPVPEDMISKVVEYCCNDVLATEAVWNARHDDFVAREILADISGGDVNDTTNQLTTKLIFGNITNPQLVYTDLSTGLQDPPMYQNNSVKGAFPGYAYTQDENGHWHNMYKGEDVGFGGYIWSKPGVYKNVALLDSASHHPSSAIAMNYFGEKTKVFKELLDTRIAIKHKEYDKAAKYFGGKLAPYLKDASSAKALSQALKIVINSVYGLTAAKFKNAFHDDRNVNNIVALRGALFMADLKRLVMAKGYDVVAIKTDSIKIPDATPEIIKIVQDFGKEYGYTFEHEATYARMCQINDADYVALYADAEWCQNKYGYVPGDNNDHPMQWTATGDKFQHPYIFKTLFSKEEVVFEDRCETKSVSGEAAIYLDMNELLPDGEHDYTFVGKVGSFCPIAPFKGGGVLLRGTPDGRYTAVTGSKGYRWLESEVVKSLDKEGDLDERYYESLVADAIDSISQYCNFYEFVSGKNFDPDTLPF